METKKKIELFKLDEDNDKLLASYTEMTGLSRSETINKALAQMLRAYEPDNGLKTKGVFHRGISFAEQASASNEGQIAKTDDVDCWILGKAEIYGQPYYRIFFDGRLMKVPAEYVEEQ